MKIFSIVNFTGVLLVAATHVSSCVLPVFRYALERWGAEPYTAVLFSRTALNAQDSTLAHELEQRAYAQIPTNIQLIKQDPDSIVDEEIRAIWNNYSSRSLPFLAITYPQGVSGNRYAWAGQMQRDVIAKLVDSPARGEIAKRIRLGESAVWVLLESGNKSKDRAARKRLTKTLKKMNKTLKLSEITEENMPGWFDPESGPRLRVHFSMISVSRKDKNEEHFINLLLNAGDSSIISKGEPLFFPIFGQGRSLDAIVGTTATEEDIANLCAFIIGECSCTVKEMNPGFDVLMTVDWSDLAQEKMSADEELPALTGLSSFIEGAGMSESDRPKDVSGEVNSGDAGARSTDGAVILFSKGSTGGTDAISEETPGVLSKLSTMKRSMLFSAGLIVILLVAGSMIVILRKRKS